MDTKGTGSGKLRRVLFATDRSAASRAALIALAGLAVGGRAEVVVLHVVEDGHVADGVRFAAEIAGGLIAVAVAARPEVRRAAGGGVAAEIAAAADQLGADLVVLGSRGRSDLGGLLLGSVGHDVLARVTCPVLLVRAGRRAAGRRRKVLLALAGDEDLDDLVRTTAAVAERDSRVLVLHLLAPGEGDPQPARSEQLVERTVAGLRRCGVRARGRARAPVRDIAATALDYGADLIVMGSRRLRALTTCCTGASASSSLG